MKSFRSYIETLNEASGAVLFARLKAVKSRLPRARRHITTKQDAVKAKTLPKPSAPLFPWWTGGDHTTGWWSASNAFIFVWSMSGSRGNFHVTQIVKNPARFGTSEAEIKDLLEKWAAELPRTRDAEKLYNGLIEGSRDKFARLEMFVFDKGWVRVVTSHTPSWKGVELEGNTKDLRKAVAAAMASCPWEEGKEYIITVHPSDVMVLGGKTLSGMSEMEAYVQGRSG